MQGTSKTIVIAAHVEDLRWTERLEKSFQVVVLSKSTKSMVPHAVSLPNTGREAHSYLWYIVHNYSNLPLLCVFCQGWPFDHCPAFLAELEKVAPESEFTPLSKERAVFDSFGMPHLVGASPSTRHGTFYEFYKKLFDTPPPPLMYARMNALFAVRREAILQWPLSFYESALRMCEEESEPEASRGAIEAHYFERVWHILFAREKEIAKREALWSMPREEHLLVAPEIALWRDHLSARRLQDAVAALITVNQKLAHRYPGPES